MKSREPRLKTRGLKVLVDGEDAGVYLAVSRDQFRSIYYQGHPEYDINSLLKEYKREVQRYLEGVHTDYPPYPDHYFTPKAQQILENHRTAIQNAPNRYEVPEFPEAELLPLLDNTWTDTGKAMFNNWLGLVYRVTHPQRSKLFMDGINPENPLGL